MGRCCLHCSRVHRSRLCRADMVAGSYDHNESRCDFDDGSCDFSCFVNSELCGIGTSWNDELSLCVAESEDNDCPQDISGDGLVNVFDLLILLAEFNGTCP